MEFSELKKLIDDGLEFEDMLNEEIKVNKYINLVEKATIVDWMLENILTEENNLYTVDRLKYEILMAYSVLNFYTGITFENTDINDDLYDYVGENEIFNKIVNAIGSDYYKFKNLLDIKIEDKLRQKNSLEGILANGIKMLTDKIPDEKGMKSMMKQLQNIKPEKMGFLTDILKLNNPSSSPIPPKVKKSKKVK